MLLEMPFSCQIYAFSFSSNLQIKDRHTQQQDGTMIFDQEWN